MEKGKMGREISEKLRALKNTALILAKHDHDAPEVAAYARGILCVFKVLDETCREEV